MPANVTVHYKAQSDHRINFLAKLLGVTVDDAFGKMVRLWSVMTELQTDMPDVELINAIMLDEHGSQLLVRSGLAETLEDATVRVKGRVDNDTGRDRLEWYGSQLDRSVKGGTSRAATAVRDARGRMTSGIAPATDQPTPASSSQSPALRSEDQILSGGSSSSYSSLSGADPRGDQDREAPEKTEAELAEAEGLVLPPNPPLRNVSRSPELPLTDELVSTTRLVAETKAIGKRVWDRLCQVRSEVAAELKVEVRPLHPFDAGTRALASRIREAQIAKLDGDRIEADLNHVVDVIVTEARATKSVQWLTGAVFEERAYRRALGMTLDDAKRAQPRTTNNGTRPGPKPEQPSRKIPTL